MTETPRAHEGPRRGRGIVVAMGAAIALGLLAAPLYAVLNDRPEGSTPMSMGDVGGTAVDLNTLPTELAALYKGAESHGSHFEQIPCFCGCQEGRLEHGHLLDCFVLKSGGGWESHAVGCAVCQGEARTALRLLEAGMPVMAVRKQIVDEFGVPEEIQDLQEG